MGSMVDREQLSRRGHVVVPGAVPERLLAPARRLIADRLGLDLEVPDGWYPRIPLDWSVVPIHQAQELWDLRQHPEIHRVFAEILGTSELWVTMDRVIYKPPESMDRPEHAGEHALHWDLDPRALQVPEYQGMVFLTDAPVDQVPFECVPSLFADLERYLQAHPILDPEDLQALDGHDVVPVPACAGDLVIWDARLPHRGGRNRGRAPRISVPIRMHGVGTEEQRIERIRCWEERRAPAWWRGWKGQLEQEPGAPAALTPLGRRLLGLDRW